MLGLSLPPVQKDESFLRFFQRYEAEIEQTAPENREVVRWELVVQWRGGVGHNDTVMEIQFPDE